MLSQGSITNLNQARFDALVAVYLHIECQKRLKNYLFWVDLGAFIISFIFILGQSVTSGNLRTSIAWIGSILSGLALILVIVSWKLDWQNRLQRHSKLLGRNLQNANEIRQLLQIQETITDESVDILLRQLTDTDEDDIDLLAEVSDKERQKAYREALKRFIPSDSNSRCPLCKASPFKYKPGSCAVCGNTPEIN